MLFSCIVFLFSFSKISAFTWFRLKEKILFSFLPCVAKDEWKFANMVSAKLIFSFSSCSFSLPKSFFQHDGNELICVEFLRSSLRKLWTVFSMEWLRVCLSFLEGGVLRRAGGYNCFYVLKWGPRIWHKMMYMEHILEA